MAGEVAINLMIQPRGGIYSTLWQVLPEHLLSPYSFVGLTAIGLQETEFRERRQVADWGPGRTPIFGPARGWWQFEIPGVTEVMTHRKTRALATGALIYLGYGRLVGDPAAVHRVLEHNDVLAATFARLLLSIDPRPLPTTRDGHMALWLQYVAQWRPGAPKPSKFPQYYQLAWDLHHAKNPDGTFTLYTY